MQKYRYTYILFDILRNQYQIDYEFRNTKSLKRKKIYKKLQEKCQICLAACSNKELLFHIQGKYSLKKRWRTI